MEASATLLESLRSVRWDIAFRVFGNSHSTLIGLLVDWWITAEPMSRWALEGGPSFAYAPRGVGGGICDAILGEGGNSRGVLEVEGTRMSSTIQKMGKFLASTTPDLQTLRFGIFLAYAYAPQGQGDARHIAALPLDDYVEQAITVTQDIPSKPLALLALDKHWSRHRTGPRARNEYYMGTPWRVRGAVVSQGRLLVRERLLAMGTTVCSPQ